MTPKIDFEKGKIDRKNRGFLDAIYFIGKDLNIGNFE